jgi:hypothetical protein
MRMSICYLYCHEAWLCCYLMIHIENLLYQLLLFYFYLLTLPRISFRTINFPCDVQHSFSVLHVMEWYVESDVWRRLPRRTSKTLNLKHSPLCCILHFTPESKHQYSEKRHFILGPGYSHSKGERNVSEQYHNCEESYIERFIMKSSFKKSLSQWKKIRSF